VLGRTTQSPRNSTPYGNLAVIPTGAKRSGGISRSRQARFLDSLRSLRLRSGQAPRNDEFPRRRSPTDVWDTGLVVLMAVACDRLSAGHAASTAPSGT